MTKINRKLEQLNQRIPNRKIKVFSTPTTTINYTGEPIWIFLSKIKTDKTLRQILLLSKLGSAFDIIQGDELKI